jgi:hypothetical protein
MEFGRLDIDTVKELVLNLVQVVLVDFLGGINVSCCDNFVRVLFRQIPEGSALSVGIDLQMKAKEVWLVSHRFAFVDANAVLLIVFRRPRGNDAGTGSINRRIQDLFHCRFAGRYVIEKLLNSPLNGVRHVAMVILESYTVP